MELTRPFSPLLIRVKKDDTLSKNTFLHSSLSMSPKPSFLLWDKVYRKVTAAEDQVWLLRALEALLRTEQQKIGADELTGWVFPDRSSEYYFFPRRWASRD